MESTPVEFTSEPFELMFNLPMRIIAISSGYRNDKQEGSVQLAFSMTGKDLEQINAAFQFEEQTYLTNYNADALNLEVEHWRKKYGQYVDKWCDADRLIESLRLELAEEKKLTRALTVGQSDVINKASHHAQENMRLKGKIDKALKYCLGNTEKMWAATIVGELLTCDFRDSKIHLNKYLGVKNEKD